MAKRSRAEWVAQEKGEEHAGCYTSSELAAYLGLSTQNLNREVREGRMPPHDFRTPAGWRLWSPETARKCLDKRLRRNSVETA